MSHSPLPLPPPSPDDRRTAAELFQRANQWLVAKRPEKAAPILRQCCRLDPVNLIYRQVLHTARKQERPKSGVLVRLRRWIAARRLRAGLQSQDWLAVLDCAEELLEFEPANTAGHLALARAYESCTLLDHAVWSLEQIGNPDDAVKMELRRLYERVGRYSQARSGTSVVLDVQTQTEIAALRERIEKTPGGAELYLQIVRLLRRTGDLHSARDWLERGLAATKNDFDLSLERADLDLTVLRKDAAMAAEKLTADPNDLELVGIRDRLQHEIQSRELDLLRQRADRFPGDMEQRLELGVQLLKVGQFDAALEAFQAVRGEQKLAWRALVYSGYCHLNWGNRKRAAVFFEEALPLIPPEAGATRADVLSKLAEWRKNAGTT